MRFLSLIFCILLLIPCITASAAESEEFSISLPEGFAAVYEGQKDKSETAKLLGLSDSELESYFEQNNVLMVAVNSDNSAQLRLCKYKNDFSELAYDMNTLSAEEIAELAPLIADTEEETTTIPGKNATYITFSEQHSDSGGSYTATQYITVFEGDIYRLSCYNQGESESELMREAFLSLKLKGDSQHALPLWLTLLMIAAIALFAAIGIAMIIGIIRDKKSESINALENE